MANKDHITQVEGLNFDINSTIIYKQAIMKILDVTSFCMFGARGAFKCVCTQYNIGSNRYAD